MPEGTAGQGWYRIRFRLEEAPSSVHIVGITHPRANRTDFFVNGKVIGGAGDLIAGRSTSRQHRPPQFGTPLHVTVPPKLMRAGENTIHVRIHATSLGTLMHGLPQVIFGEARELRTAYLASSDAGFYAQRIFFAMALTSGIITFFLWLARRSDRVMFWYSVACLAWGLVSIPRLALRWVDAFAAVVPVLSWFLNYALVVPLVVLCLRTVNIKWLGFEAALWAYLVIEASFPFWGQGGAGPWRVGWDAANTVLLLTGIAILLLYAERPMRWTVRVQLVAFAAMAALMSVEVLRYLGWIDIDFKRIRHYHVPLMLLAIGAVIFERHVLAVRRTEQANVELERLVVERTREIEANYARVEEAAREKALAQERQRILADIHDGLGASLIGLLRHAQSNGADRAGIERRIQEALHELKASVDVLQPRAGDLDAVLVSMRYRLDSMIRGTGIRLIWEVGELPPMARLNPSAVFELQRILLEAITNVLKHSGARQIGISAYAHGDSGVAIEIEDDGCGFDPRHAAPGLGLSNMRTRAARIDATLEISPRPVGGTVVKLALPGYAVGTVARAVFDEPEAGPSGVINPAGVAS
jgi:signal transduction histidine kinase